ncbi:MAG: ABC-2 type transport system permease protein [Verrucomicrobiales bacterium]|jgi:ABC-2 type transport system permease protein
MSSAEIFDRGYRAYDGPRTGVGTGMRAVGISAIQRALGLRRKFRFKIVPLVTIAVSYLPAIGFLAIAILLPGDLGREVVPEYAGYFGLINVLMVLLAAFVVPEVMGSDRKTGMFGLYMASPLTRWHYLTSKFVAIVMVMSLVTLLPVVFQMVGYSFLDIGPDGFTEIVKTLLRIIASGFILSIFFSLFGMAASTFTDRQLFASAAIVILIIASEAFTVTLVEGADAPEWIRVFGLLNMPANLIARVFSENSLDSPQIEGVSDLASFGIWFGFCTLFAGLVLYGYRRLEVTK